MTENFRTITSKTTSLTRRQVCNSGEIMIFVAEKSGQHERLEINYHGA